MSPDCLKLSKLDRFLVCPNFMSVQPLSAVTVLPRELSDHSPITLCRTELDYGPPPFRFYNSRLLKEGFMSGFFYAWNSFVGYGTPISMLLASKLKHLKIKLKAWRKVEFHKETEKRKTTSVRINELELLAETRPLSVDEISELKNDRIKILELEQLYKQDLKQRARIKWTIDGDENTSFFHGSLKNKLRNNRIHGLNIDGVWVSNPASVKLEVWKFFSAKFKEKWPTRPKLVNPLFKRLSQNDSSMLEAAFSGDEIKSAIWDCGCEKSPGPDGFSFKLLKEKWEIIKEDVMNFVHFFDQSATFAPGCNSSFITLVPKIKDPINLCDYQPISLIGCMSKIISKALSNRLKRVIGSIIDDVQSAFIEGRNILEGPLVMNEICSWAKKSKKKTLIFKVDFEKAFDSINWDFLDSVMDQMGFGLKWRRWIRGILASSRASVLVNGSPTKEFPIFKGVRQGDPLSPFLFIIAMEGLNVAMKSACTTNLFRGEWCYENIRNLATILRCFNVSSGLQVNFHKSKVYGVGASSLEINNWASLLGCVVGSLPFTYLGVPVGANMSLKKN